MRREPSFGVMLASCSPWKADPRADLCCILDVIDGAVIDVGWLRVGTWSAPMNSPVSEAGFGIFALLKGMGEADTVTPPTAIANAVCDALAPLGIEVNEAPLTPGRVRAALERASITAGWHEGGR